MNRTAIAEMQFADYIFPAFDQQVIVARREGSAPTPLASLRRGRDWTEGYGLASLQCPARRARVPLLPLSASVCVFSARADTPHFAFASHIPLLQRRIVNEAAKYRYRSGNQFNVGGLTFRAPYGAVGHGGHYHSQSPEAYFTHTPGLKVVVPRDPVQAKGLLLASIRDPDPVLFLEPKALYRASVGDVPTGDYTLPLGKADVVRAGSDVTVIGWGAQMRVLEKASWALRAPTGALDCALHDGAHPQAHWTVHSMARF